MQNPEVKIPGNHRTSQSIYLLITEHTVHITRSFGSPNSIYLVNTESHSQYI